MSNNTDLQPIVLNDGRHCLADTVKQVRVNQAVQLKQYSGQIIPTTKDAVQAIKMLKIQLLYKLELVSLSAMTAMIKICLICKQLN